jgi:uncharacterized protein involved in exopolysaccharide biosynthesis
MKHFTACVALLCALAASASAQEVKPEARARGEETQAYRMLRARKVAAESELEKMLTMYTPTFPGVLSKQYELDVIAREAARMLSTEPGQLDRLTATYGDIVLRRIALEVEVRDVLTTYTPRHPLVREKLCALSGAEREAAEYWR